MADLLLPLIVVTLALLFVSLGFMAVSSRRKLDKPRTKTAPPTQLRRPPEAPRPPLIPTRDAPATAPVAPTPVDIGDAPPVDAPEALPIPPAPVHKAEVVLEPVAEPEPEVDVEPEPVKPRLRDRLGKARAALSGNLRGVLSRGIDDETWDELEEALIRADVGVATTQSLLENLRAQVKAERIRTPEELLAALKSDLVTRLEGDTTLRKADGKPTVWLFVGVNGVGKTTTIGKVARREVNDGSKVVLAAGDTFRAAAAEQLGLWAERSGSDLVRGAEGSDPGAVVFDAVERAAARGANLVLADTAGRLHNKANLMEELRKVHRVAGKGPGELTETLLVIDATTGNNGLAQAKEFGDVAGVTGVVLTKLDGTAKGGIALAIRTELGIPIKLVGLGEGADDLVEFDAREFVDALFDA